MLPCIIYPIGWNINVFFSFCLVFCCFEVVHEEFLDVDSVSLVVNRSTLQPLLKLQPDRPRVSSGILFKTVYRYTVKNYAKFPGILFFKNPAQNTGIPEKQPGISVIWEKNSR